MLLYGHIHEVLHGIVQAERHDDILGAREADRQDKDYAQEQLSEEFHRGSGR